MKNRPIPGKKVTGDQAGNNPSPEKMFTKEQVNDLMKKRVERSHNSFYTRYGVKDLSEMDALFSKAKNHDAMKGEIDELTGKNTELTSQLKDLTKKYGYKSCNINPDKINDIETYFKGKNLDIDENSLATELKTHPDWVSKPVTIENLGAEQTPPPEVDEAAEASRFFGVDLTK